ncbi:hypothetical protein AVEN_273780-1 [Araneus ventricosus]|uniref:acid phosphatase n=1 Tax=Araneus ventricosus TaxID=182803 RepID=A0A4Y2N0V8_ARAVE|nr:hypothetical protein AVEN_273780-1 [Araneus ventricosus]
MHSWRHLLRLLTSEELFQLKVIGPILHDIIQNMKMKINGNAPDLKVRMYSAHDINVAAVLKALNFTNMPRPPYCATLLFELHEMSDASMAVQLLYLNSTDPLANMGEPHVLELDGCSEFCPVEKFTEKVLHLISDNWEEECQFGTGIIFKSSSLFSFLLLCIHIYTFLIY